MGKKVNILTFCAWRSIGSILQSYALSKILKDNGYENTVLLEEWNRTFFKDKLGSFKDYFKWVYKKICGKNIILAHYKRQNFISEYMEVKYFSTYDIFKENALKSHEYVYLTGSDQVWNPDRCNPLFFLDFAGNNKRISYAASMGQTKIPPEKEARIATWLRSFDYISVREQDCVSALEKLVDKDISVHIDPTFLIDIKEWRKLEIPYNVKEPYILLYMLYWDKSCKGKIKALKKRTGLPVYAVCSDVSRVYADHRLYDVGVEEFLWLVDHAEYVVTSSFHGVALSVIFQKQFSAVINPQMPSRIENVMNVLQVPKVSIEELDTAERFDYETVFKNIEKERNRSIEYLKEAIG